MCHVRDLDDGRAARPKDTVHLGELSGGVGQVMQHPDHRDQVDARVGEVQARRIHQPLLNAGMIDQKVSRQGELLAARVHERGFVGELGEHHAEPAVTATDVSSVAELAALQQPPDGDHLSAMLIVSVGPVALVIKALIVIESGPIIQVDVRHKIPPVLGPREMLARRRRCKLDGMGILSRLHEVLTFA